MNYQSRQSQVHLTRKDLSGVSAGLRTIYTVSDNGDFDGLLKRLDAVYEGDGGGRQRARWR